MREGRQYGDNSGTKFPHAWILNLYRFSCINKRNISFSQVLEQLWDNTFRIDGNKKIGQKSLVKF